VIISPAHRDDDAFGVGTQRQTPERRGWSQPPAPPPTRSDLQHAMSTASRPSATHAPIYQGVGTTQRPGHHRQRRRQRTMSEASSKLMYEASQDRRRRLANQHVYEHTPPPKLVANSSDEPHVHEQLHSVFPTR
jgi:hypothetical protein